jgi:phosphatidylserine/phosphatidylglycerophosphate/cardiolipin synthase-like enzyme
VSTSVAGTVLDENGSGLSGLTVVVTDVSALISTQLGTTTTGNDGAFTVSIGGDPVGAQSGERQLEVSVQAGVVRRPVYVKTVADDSGSTTNLGQITLNQKDVQGWAVSLPGTTNALPVRNGNALRALVDNKVAWDEVATAISAAESSVSVMQLTVDVPRTYNADATHEEPEIVLKFPDAFDGDTGVTQAIDPQQFPRPERLLLSSAQAGHQVRVLISAYASTLINAAMWIDNVKNSFKNRPRGDADAVAGYLAKGGTAASTTGFPTHGFSVVHQKVVLVDAASSGGAKTQALLLGSPFEQSYWDTNTVQGQRTEAHEVFDARRGSCTGEPVPVHDVSISIRGPMVTDIQEQFRVHWNKVAPTDQVSTLDPPAEISSAGTDEYVASAQLVRTVNVQTLPGLDDGEEGVLEAYLRAIENATDYIYFENQYFTCERIGRALVAALTDTNRPNLQVILMIPVVPDMPFYPYWQTSLIARMRRDAPAAVDRLGVFTAWSHAAPSHDHTKPVIMPDYLHTKSAVVDGKWATIGSANLDGASLDEFQILRPVIGVNRNDELNCVVFNEIDGCPHTDFVDQFRTLLWSEHLGIPQDDPRLSAATLSANHGWLELWSGQAKAKLAALVDDPTTPDPKNGRVLAYPAKAKSGAILLLPWQHPYRNFLQTAGVDLTKIDLVEHTTAFNFAKGKWKAK